MTSLFIHPRESFVKRSAGAIVKCDILSESDTKILVVFDADYKSYSGFKWVDKQNSKKISENEIKILKKLISVT